MERRTHKRLARLGVLLLAVLLISVLGIMSFAAESEPPADDPACYDKGDVNADGSVDNRDAIYTLYHHMFGEEYPVAQNWDFNGDDAQNNKDAIYVLYHYLYPEDADYALEGVAHGYYDPAWKWTESGNTVTAEVTVKCGCTPTPHTLTIDEGVSVTSRSVREATCTATGLVEYTATVTYQDQTFTATMEKDSQALGHDLNGQASCHNSSNCRRCDYVEAAWGHTWVLNPEKSTPATCTAQAVQVYDCAVCEKENPVTLEGTLAHELTYYQAVPGTDKSLGNCQFVKQYRCESCKEVFDGTAESDIYTRHSYTATLTQEATCQEPGVKTYTCSVCADSYTEAVPNPDAHSWDEGTTDGSTITYHCTNGSCAATKTAVDASASAVNKEDLEDVTELQLNNGAAMALEEDTLEELQVEQSIQVEVKTADLSGLDEEQKAQVGDNTVYDFTMKVDGQAVSNFTNASGEDVYITISLPYTLAPGEDVESIDVWYLDDASGDPVRVDAVYSNGFVTFQTKHFSRYTVTRLTPAERCERYGHVTVDSQKAATCTEDGYTMSACHRCGAIVEKTVINKLGHDTSTTETKATCSVDGEKVTACSRCDYESKEVLPASGHNMKTTEKAATCEAAGEVVSTCQNSGCTYSTKKVLPQLAHKYVLTETKKADCTNKGYKLEVCERCDKERVTDEQAPIGHNYITENAKWNWAADCSSATVELVCAHDKTHVKTMNAVVTSVTKAVSSCLGGGAVDHTATVSINGISFSDTKEVTTGTGSHTPGGELLSDTNSHYYACSVCGEKTNAAGHTWGEETVKTAATCVEDGTAAASCTVCGYEKTWALPATGEHTFVHDKCTVCGFDQGNCDHLPVNKTELELSSYHVCAGGKVYLQSCSCGRNQILEFDLECKIENATEGETTGPNGEEIYTMTGACSDCGLQVEQGYYNQADKEACVAYQTVIMKLTMGDSVLADTSYCYYDMAIEHPWAVMREEVDLSDKGVCGEVLQIGTCYCGKTLVANEKESCDWYYNDENSNEDTTVYDCVLCGTRKVISDSYSEGDQKCLELHTYTLTYYVKGQVVYTFEGKEEYTSHDYKTTGYEMLGETCEDGVTVAQQCETCGHTVRSQISYHAGLIEARTDLDDYDFCADALIQYTCPCGKGHKSYELEYSGDECQWMWINYNEKTRTELYQCQVCGVIRETAYSLGEKDEYCRCMSNTYASFSDSKGNHIVTGYEAYQTEDHNEISTGELLGTTCEDGVQISSRCADCDWTNVYVTHYHETWAKEIYDLSQYDVCVDGIEIWGCACGENTYTQWLGDNRCSFQWESGSQYGYTEVCTECGLTYEMKQSGREKDGCQVIYTYQEIYSLNGASLLETEAKGFGESHEYRYTFTLRGETCADGYTVTETCANCDYVWEDPEVYTECNTYLTGKTVIHDGTGLCGEVAIHYYACPCGAKEESGFQYGCQNWNYDNYDQSTEMHMYTCTECGLVRGYGGSYDPTEDPCKVAYTVKYCFIVDGETLDSGTLVNLQDDHEYVYQLTLLGETCYEGFTYTGVCEECQNTTSGTRYDHETYTLAYYDLADYGMCGGYVEVRGCACGQYRDWNDSNDCVWQETGKIDAETGLEEVYCQKCQTSYYIGEVGERDPETCRFNGNVVVKLVRGGQTLLNATSPVAHESHDYQVSGAVLDNPEGDCEDGITVTYTCTGCQDSFTNHRYYHEYETQKNVDLSQLGACGGTLTVRTCACGLQSQSLDTECTNVASKNWVAMVDGVQHRFNSQTCNDCGLVEQSEQYQKPASNSCEINNTAIVTLTMDGETVESITEHWTTEVHDWETSYALKTAGTKCTDGVIATQTCRDCGIKVNWESNAHHVAWKSSLDLAEYGAVCGTVLDLYTCACGDQSHYSLPDNSNCDLDQEYTSVWIEGAINGEQYNTDGYTYAYSDAYTFICSVTDPVACGLKIRMAEYWLYNADTCEAVEYQTWQLGYDETDSSFIKEITIATGERKTWHNYTASDIDTTEDGMTVSGTAYTCACGSTWTEKIYISQGSLVAQVRECVNARADGKDVLLRATHEYGYAYQDQRLITLSLNERKAADGKETVYSYAYSYPFDTVCKRQATYTDPNGVTSTEVETSHGVTPKHEITKQPTCTQYGAYRDTETCVFCGLVTYESTGLVEPNDHSFNMNEDTGLYECSACGLESTNQATGDVVLEDLTAAYGNGTAYVAGFWNSKNLEGAFKITAVLQDVAEGENDELLLTDIQLTWLEEVAAVSVSAADIQAAVEAAGYTGGYSVRLNFVPSVSTELDYAITFDPIIAQ